MRPPSGQPRRPSKSLTLDQANILVAAAEGAQLGAYVVVCLLTGVRTEEARALTWEHVDLDGDPAADPPVPAHIAVWRSVRAHGDTKTQQVKRTLRLPCRAVAALREHQIDQADQRLLSGDLAAPGHRYHPPSRRRDLRRPRGARLAGPRTRDQRPDRRFAR